jgi:hypothetical protein
MMYIIYFRSGDEVPRVRLRSAFVPVNGIHYIFIAKLFPRLEVLEYVSYQAQ